MSDAPEVDPLAVCAMPTRCLASLHGRDRCFRLMSDGAVEIREGRFDLIRLSPDDIALIVAGHRGFFGGGR